MTDFRALCAELIEAVLSDDSHIDCVQIARRARTALAQPAPPAEGDVTDAELNAMWNCSGIADEYGNHTGNIFEFARAAIALDRTRRAPVLKEKGICPACEGSPTAANNPCAVCGCSAAPPAEGEVGELVEWLRQTGDLIQPSHLAEHQRYKRAADLLSQRHSAPVPVAERSPEPEDCDGEGRCWWWNPPTYLAGTGWWEFEPYEWIEDATHWLPAHALPLPAGEVQP